ncbi:MAG: TIGR01212 family radical SAM protein [Planctomycetota bacterium]|nr:TIGR01212 family radical SAM protein [Planctomycetota bacterium]MDA1114473.1 TIGR01212 family radical SAM protein [Planctomycetota bacterium]
MISREAPVHTLGRSLKQRYGRRLRRVMLDLGLTCPNRDGNSGYGGCIYCDLSGSGTGAAKREEDLATQWQDGLTRARKVNPEGQAAIIYFQSYSNTYPDLTPLSEALEQIREWSSVAPILAIGTRPDCFSEEAADLLAAQKPFFDEVWIEFGLETADDHVQKVIGRHDTLENFHIACERAGTRGLHRIAHCIAGLPEEKDDGLLRQVEEIAKAGCEGIKFHQMMVLRKTKLAKMWMDDKLDLLHAPEYIQMVADALEQLPPEVIVHRLVAEAPETEYLAPKPWPGRQKVHSLIEQELQKRGTGQGSRLKTP